MKHTHTEWLLRVLSELDDSARESIISICLAVLDAGQFQERPEFRLKNAGDILETVKRDEVIEDMKVKEILMLKGPTIGNLEEAIDGLVKAGIAEPFLITSLYDFICHELDYGADAVERRRGDENLRKRLEAIRERPAAVFPADEPGALEDFTAFVEERLAASGEQLAKNQAIRDAWREATHDREAQPRVTGWWYDLLDLAKEQLEE